MLTVPTFLAAGLIGLLAAIGLLLGAIVGYTDRLSHRAIATVTGFGAGVLIAVLTLELLVDSHEHGSAPATAIGFLLGALLFSTINRGLERREAAHRKRCGACVAQPTEEQAPGSGTAIAVGALIDGIPESIAIGLTVATTGGSGAPVALVAGFFLANIPQGISSASGMRQAGRSRTYVLGVWSTVVATSTLAAVLGAVAFADAGGTFLAGLTALAAGGVLAMLAETMIPEAFHLNHRFIGVITATGVVVALLLQ
ncbi:ZIP family metal transporter [Streptomyces sp. NPDC017546]|uniref:ZIP family metal transporter n=1 Tax=Streptomyces sp. NPDC017546 TaxID=3365001 RepID=UPI00378F8728